MICQICDQEEAFMTLIPTGPEGLPQSVGPACFSRMGLDLAKQILPAEEIAAIIGPMFVTPAREDLHDGAKQEVAKRSRKSPAKREPDAGPAEGPAETPPTAQNE